MTESDTTELTEEDVREIADEQQSVETPDGETLRLADVLDINGIDRGKAFGVLWLASIGLSATAAASVVSTMSSDDVRAQASTGSGVYEVDEIIANLLDTAEVQADTLSGPVVGRPEPIDHFPGNIELDTDEPSNPTDNDLLFQEGGGS